MTKNRRDPTDRGLPGRADDFLEQFVAAAIEPIAVALRPWVSALLAALACCVALLAAAVIRR